MSRIRTIEAEDITERVRDMCIEANCILPKELIAALERARDAEESPVGRQVLEQILENAEIARTEMVASCQDTGVAVFFVELGEEVFIWGNLRQAIEEGVRQGYREGYLRKSMCDPFSRKNTGDNTPAVIHIDTVPGAQLKITFAPKGGGSENMSRLTMLSPSQGKQGIIDFAVKTVEEAGANPCPPIVLGIGVGGCFERCAILAKKALLRVIGTNNPDSELDEMEKEILVRVNNLGIGPQGLGGRATCLAVHIEKMPCHIASLPVAVNIQCHAARHKEVVL